MLLLPHFVRACTTTEVILGSSSAYTRIQTLHWFTLPCNERTALVVSCGMYSVTTTPLLFITVTAA